jgi:hypothetical protein
MTVRPGQVSCAQQFVYGVLEDFQAGQNSSVRNKEKTDLWEAPADSTAQLPMEVMPVEDSSNTSQEEVSPFPVCQGCWEARAVP